MMSIHKKAKTLEKMSAQSETSQLYETFMNNTVQNTNSKQKRDNDIIQFKHVNKQGLTNQISAFMQQLVAVVVVAGKVKP